MKYQHIIFDFDGVLAESNEIRFNGFRKLFKDYPRDQVELLVQYAKANGVKDGRWQFLTSDIESIKDLKKNGFMLYAGELPRGHAIKFVLIDQDGQIRKYYDGTDKASMAVLRKDLNNIVNEIQS